MSKKNERPAVVILAAGLSDRMGHPKHDLRFSEESTFLGHIITVYQKYVASQIVLVINDRDDFRRYYYEEELKIVVNKNPEFGRFHSVQLGLKEIEGVHVFIQNTDNPFVSPGLLMTVEKSIEEADFAVPVHDGKGGHPVLLSRSIVNKVACDFDNDKKLNNVLKHFTRKEVPMNDPYILVNINSEEDYKKYFFGF